MNNGWIKLHRQIMENRMWQYDHNAVMVFMTLLLIADKRKGEWSGGRHQLAEKVGLKSTTTYQALKRLEKAKMVTLSSNNKYTVIHLCNFKKYQQVDDKSNDNQMTTRRQPDDTLTRIKNKELRSIYISKDILVETQKVYDLFIKEFDRNPNLYKLTDSRKNKIKTRLKDAGYDLIAQAITNTSKQPFYRGDGPRGWIADLDFIIRSYENVERLATQQTRVQKGIDIL
jgi:hypothetical protein